MLINGSTRKMIPDFIFRALRPEEIALGMSLIPKLQQPFLAHPRLAINLPFHLGERLEYAVRDHQDKGLYETSGVSTTPRFDRAEHYAHLHKVIVKIATGNFNRLCIKAYPVVEYLSGQQIMEPKDEEIILCYMDGKPFPKEIIAEVFDKRNVEPFDAPISPKGRDR